MVSNAGPGLEKDGLTKVARIGSDPSADFAQESGVGNKGFVLFRVANLIAEIVQITQVFVVARMRHN
jgi:hypothetical protein